MLYFLLKAISRLPLPFLYAVANVMVFILYYTPSSLKKISRINLALAYPHLNISEQKHLLQQTLKSQCYTYIESMKCWGMPKTYSHQLFDQVHGQYIFQEALNNKKGVIIVITHFGCWELLNVWLNQYTTPMIMYKPNKNKSVDRFMREAREHFDAILVPTNETGVRAIFKHLKQGGLTVILPDHLPKPSGGIYSKFFGQEVLCTTLVSKLAQKTQCNILGLSCIRNQHHAFDIHCHELNSEIITGSLQRSVDCLNLDMQYMINQAPAQYIWSYKRFRHMPNQPNIYS